MCWIDNIGMKQFQVPQFITIEDKIFGPFTFKQFLFLGGGAFLVVMAYVFFETYLLILVAIPIAALAAALAFLKINEQPFPLVFLNAIKFFLKPRLYLWKQIKDEKKPSFVKTTEDKEGTLVKKIPKLSESKLIDLAWSLDIQEKMKR